MKKTKIVATVGPASERKDSLENMVRAGVNVFRLNFSHGSFADHEKIIKNIRKIEQEIGRRIGILADIQGPRIRVASRKELKLEAGDEVLVTDEKSAYKFKHKNELLLDWNGFYEHLGKGKLIFIEDGLILLKTTRKLAHGILAEVEIGGVVKPRKGVNIPSISHYMGFLTDKDLLDLEFILSQEIDFLGVSFVGSKRDLKSLRKIIDYTLKKKFTGKKYQEKKENEGWPWIISKVERKTAMKNLDEIIEYSDGIMVARGDLAIEEPQEKVTIYQKDIIAKCRRAKRPVIVATQMMSSMTENIRPTRAEIADVTNAVIDNADAVMLSNESAVGAYPVETVLTMSKIIQSAEDSPYNDIKLSKRTKLAKLFIRATKESSKNSRRKIARASNVDEAIAFSSLRQEDTTIKIVGVGMYEKRKGALLWGTE